MRKEEQSVNHFGRIEETSASGGTNTSVRSSIFGVYLKIAQENEDLLESLISTGTIKQLLGWERSHSDTVAWSDDIEGHTKTCVERYCELANKKIEQLYKVSTPCSDDHQFQKRKNETVGELSKVCSHIGMNCFYLTRIGRPDILLSVNYLARVVTKWNEACKKRDEISHVGHQVDRQC